MMVFNEIKYNFKRSRPNIVFSLSNTIRFPNSLIESWKPGSIYYGRCWGDQFPEPASSASTACEISSKEGMKPGVSCSPLTKTDGVPVTPIVLPVE